MILKRSRKANGRKPRMLCTLLLLAQLQSGTMVWATPLSQEEIDSLLGSRTEFSRQEVAELMSNILSDADEEIERTAQEAVREVAAQDAGEITFQKSLAESWKNEAARIDGERAVWRTCTVVEAIVILGGILLFGVTR